jgi:uncharacterized membrane protein
MIADNCCRNSSNRPFVAVVATGETVGVGVIRVDFTRRRLLPVFPDERTFSVSVGMSQRCQ